MNLVLWVLQIVVALVFLLAGTVKLTQPVERLGKTMQFVKEVPEWLVRFIGLVELIGALGLILPALTGIASWLTLWAAIGLALVMLLATTYHTHKTEYNRVGVTLILLGLAMVVAIGRYVITPL